MPSARICTTHASKFCGMHSALLCAVSAAETVRSAWLPEVPRDMQSQADYLPDLTGCELYQRGAPAPARAVLLILEHQMMSGQGEIPLGRMRRSRQVRCWCLLGCTCL
jgi:hypothetical protein